MCWYTQECHDGCDAKGMYLIFTSFMSVISSFLFILDIFRAKANSLANHTFIHFPFLTINGHISLLCV